MEKNSLTWRDGIAVLAVSALAFGIRVGHLGFLQESAFFEPLIGDAWRYHEWAQKIAGGEWLGTTIFVQAPLYPYFLGAVSALLENDLWTIRIVQAILGSAACGFLYLATRGFFRSFWTGILAGGMLALYAPAIFHDALLQKSVLDIFLLCLLLGAMATHLDRPRPWVDAATGVALGLMILTRENAVLLGFPIIAWILCLRSTPFSARLVRSVAFVIGAALVLFPVALRNFDVGGEFHLTSSQLGHNLYIGNNSQADGTYQPLLWGRGDSEWMDGKKLAEEALQHSLSPAEVSDYWVGETLDYIRSEPLGWLQLLVQKFILIVNTTEIIDTEDQYTHALFSPVLAASGAIFHFGVLAPLAAFGVIVTWNQRRRLWVLYGMIFAYTASLLVFFVLARYRLPLVPLMIPFAAAALAHGSRWTRDRWKSNVIVLSGAASCVAFVAALSNFPNIERSGMQATNLYNLGIAQRRASLFDASLLSFRKSVEIIPTYAEAHTALANGLAQAGNFDESFRHFQIAVDLEPGIAGIRHDFGLALSRNENFYAASLVFYEAIQLDPSQAAAYYYKGLAQLHLGQLKGAARAIEQAILIDPSYQIRLRHAAWLHVTTPNQPFVPDAERALQMARWAVRFGGKEDPEALSTLAAALASTGRFQRAARAASQSVALAQAKGDPIQVTVMKIRRGRILEGRRIQR